MAKRKQKINLSYRSYRAACDDAFNADIFNPAVFWHRDKGFYAASCLLPPTDILIRRAYYDLNDGGRRSSLGTRMEYRPIAQAIREFYVKSCGSDYYIEDITVPSVHTCKQMTNGEQCYGYVYSDGTCDKCGHCYPVALVERYIPLKKYVHDRVMELEYNDDVWS